MPHAIITGPIQGDVRLADGTVVDVSPPVVYVETKAEADEVAHLIGERHQSEGHPWHDADLPFTHTPGV